MVRPDLYMTVAFTVCSPQGTVVGELHLTLGLRPSDPPLTTVLTAGSLAAQVFFFDGILRGVELKQRGLPTQAVMVTVNWQDASPSCVVAV
jgi:hypothetical protein